MGDRTKMAVLIAERDAQWGTWTDALRDDADRVMIVRQHPGETASELATRVRTRVEAANADVVAATLAGGGGWDADTLGARSQIVRTVVSEMVAAGAGRLYLDAGASAGRARFAMEALAAVVQEQIRDTGVEVVTERAPAPRRRRHAA